jgi:hypothetical protein
MDGLEASLAVHSRLLLGPIAMNGSVIMLSDFEPGYKYNEPNRTQLISNLLFHTELSHHPILFQSSLAFRYQDYTNCLIHFKGSFGTYDFHTQKFHIKMQFLEKNSFNPIKV